MLFRNWCKTAHPCLGKPQNAWTPSERAEGRASPRPHPYGSSQPGDSQDLIYLNPTQSWFLLKESSRSRRIDGSAAKPLLATLGIIPAPFLPSQWEFPASCCIQTPLKHSEIFTRATVTFRGDEWVSGDAFGEKVWAAVLTKSSISVTRNMQRFVPESHHFCQAPTGDTEWLQSCTLSLIEQIQAVSLLWFQH